MQCEKEWIGLEQVSSLNCWKSRKGDWNPVYICPHTNTDAMKCECRKPLPRFYQETKVHDEL